MASKQRNDMGPNARTDFNHVTQFSLSSQKQKEVSNEGSDYRK